MIREKLGKIKMQNFAGSNIKLLLFLVILTYFRDSTKKQYINTQSLCCCVFIVVFKFSRLETPVEQFNSTYQSVYGLHGSLNISTSRSLMSQLSFQSSITGVSSLHQIASRKIKYFEPRNIYEN